MSRPRLLFVSPQFLFPLDAGGKIRTTNILRGMKGGAFDIHLISPATPEQKRVFAAEIEGVCDRFDGWDITKPSLVEDVRRVFGLASPYPVSVWSDRRPASRGAVRRALAQKPDIAVVDFTHTAVLCPASFPAPSVLFTHNVEAEIFARHVKVASGFMRQVWKLEHAKMVRFERRALNRFDTVVAVSERDANFFEDTYGVAHARAIPTGVDLDFFAFEAPRETSSKRIVFTGSMNWRANQDGIEWFMTSVWPLIAREEPKATFTVVGRDPPNSLVAAAEKAGLPWTFTGFVDDVRDHMRGADAYVIPLRVGGGTRIKAYEAMAIGLPVVSTSLGVEGLPVTAGTHYLAADRGEAFAAATVRLLREAETRCALAKAARFFVDTHYGHAEVARRFEDICMETLARAAA